MVWLTIKTFDFAFDKANQRRNWVPSFSLNCLPALLTDKKKGGHLVPPIKVLTLPTGTFLPPEQLQPDLWITVIFMLSILRVLPLSLLQRLFLCSEQTTEPISSVCGMGHPSVPPNNKIPVITTILCWYLVHISVFDIVAQFRAFMKWFWGDLIILWYSL